MPCESETKNPKTGADGATGAFSRARERWRVTQALRHSEARMRLFADASLDAMITINTRGLITQWNRRAEVLFGWTAPEIIGRSLASAIIPPRFRAAHDAGIAHFLTSGEGAMLGQRVELSALRRDGVEFPIELSVMAQRVGYTYFFSATIRDISERRANEAALRAALEQMEERIAERTVELQRSNRALEAEIERRARSEEYLRRSNERLHTVVTNAPVVLFAIDRDGVFTLSEGKGLTALGLEPGKVVGQSVFDLYENSPEILNDIHRALSGETFTGTVALGNLVFETRYMAQRDARGCVAGVFGVSIDATERSRAATALVRGKEAAEAANRTKGQFLANISHELRTPLNAIIGFSEILCDQTFGALNEKQQRYTQNVLSSGRHLLNLINAILDLSKIEAGKMELEISAFHPLPVMEEVFQIASALAAEKRIAMTLLPAAPLPQINADLNKFKQALYNLISNAVKFTPEEGRVTIGAKIRASTTQERFLEISVADTGIGVRLEDQERIFAEFEQADASFSRRQEGTGLGLTLTRRIVELHGGTINAQSEGEGQGSVFRFTLPVEPRAAEKGKRAK